LVLVCKNDGDLLLLPNLSGIKANAGSHKIPSNWIAAFDQSCRFERTPKEVNVLVGDQIGMGNQGTQTSAYTVGHATLQNVPSSASGVFNVELPPFLRSPTLTSGSLKPVMDAYAEMTGIRETSKMMMCNVVCPLIIGVFPGVPASFTYSSSLKSFGGEAAKSFSKTFEGYVYKITHEISTDGYPKTKFAMSNVSDGSFQKAAVNPFWTGASIPAW
jgi:hypothetical protein